MHRRHPLPLDRGGADDESNLVPACRPCNRAKGNLTAAEYLDKLRFVEGRRLPSKRGTARGKGKAPSSVTLGHPRPERWTILKCDECGFESLRRVNPQGSALTHAAHSKGRDSRREIEVVPAEQAEAGTDDLRSTTP